MTALEKASFATALIGATTGLIGTVLGIINTWTALRNNRVRLRVIPKLAWMTAPTSVLTAEKIHPLGERMINSRPHDRLCIEVINMSKFAVTVSDVGFGRTNHPREVLLAPEITPGKKWPVRLEPREAFVAYAAIGVTLSGHVLSQRVAYAKTDCDTVAYGRSPAFTEYCRRALSVPS